MVKARKVLLLFISLLAMPALAGEPAAVSTASSERWSALASDDLNAVHKLIVEGHPGFLDEQNPGFRVWTEQGYREALALLPQVVSYDAALAVVRYYVSGFRDGHTVYVDELRNNDTISRVNGWKVSLTKGAYVVSAVAPGWSAALPPIGSTLIQCDGQAPDDLLRDDIAPYYDRRGLSATKPVLAHFLAYEWLPSHRLKQCEFQSPDGARPKHTMLYQDIRSGDLDWIRFYAGVTRTRNSYDFRSGTLWIRAANFMLQPEDAKTLDTMLHEMPRLRGVKRIVFDTRGNVGGDSAVGERMFTAATGGLSFDDSGEDLLPKTYAQWRVSSHSISATEQSMQRAVKLYGPESEQAKYLGDRLQSMRTAQASGQQWIVQDGGGHDFTRAEIAARHGKMLKFRGRIALITDSSCFSACLDFADLVRGVPGSVHLGETTSADAVYIDIGEFPLPSGNLLGMSLKVWRNRARGNNEPLIPDVPLNIDMSDDAAVHSAVLALLNTSIPPPKSRH